MVIPTPRAPVEDEVAAIRAFFDAAPLGQLVLDVGRRIRSANPAAVRLFAVPGFGLAGRPFPELIDPASGPTMEQAFLAAAGNGASPTATVQVRAAAGGTFPVELTVLRLRTGRADGFGVIARDLRAPRAVPEAPAPPTGRAPPAYTAAELLMANRLRELV